MNSFFGSFARYLLDQQGILAFLVAIASVGTAALALSGAAAPAAAGLLVALGGGYAADRAGQSLIVTRPMGALRAMELGILAPAALAVGAGAAIIAVGISLEPPDGASAQQKALLGAVATAISSVLSVLFVKGADDPDGSWLSDRIRDAFQSRLAAVLPDDQQSANPIYSEPWGSVSGWGRKEREQRVRAAAKLLAAPRSSAALAGPSSGGSSA